MTVGQVWLSMLTAVVSKETSKEISKGCLGSLYCIYWFFGDGFLPLFLLECRNLLQHELCVGLELFHLALHLGH